jgi:hypothetical protein
MNRSPGAPALLAFALASLLCPALAGAFCGFYVAGADTELYNNATMVVMMREGTRTVLSMQNNYQGPPKDFALVVPVPVVLSEGNVKTLSRDIFERVDKLAAPRLVEYWEQDPCAPLVQQEEGFSGEGGTGTSTGYGAGGGPDQVVVEAEFRVGEYEIVILGARDALALETWLTSKGYKIPAGAARHLRPYVERGEKFFVARVDIDKVIYKDGMATLSPLRVHYDAEEFSLPIRLGLMNARDTQDLIVHILAPGQRYQLANYPNVTIPTNLVVDSAARDRFGELYAALFDATLEKHPGAVITEYAWDAGACDPCPDTPLTRSELFTLGLDVLRGQGKTPSRRSMLQVERPTTIGPMDKNIVHRYLRRAQGQFQSCHDRILLQGTEVKGAARLSFTITPAGNVDAVEVTGPGKDAAATALTDCLKQVMTRLRFPRAQAGGITKVRFDIRLVAGAGPPRTQGFVLTRLHARYDETSLGQDLIFEVAEPIQGGLGGADSLEKTALPALSNTFQGRYIIRHPWTGRVACKNPQRGVWGGPPDHASGATATQVARDLAFAPRGRVELAKLVREPIAALQASPAAPAAPPDPAPATHAPPRPRPDTSSKSKGCAAGQGGGTGLAVLFLLWLAIRQVRWHLVGRPIHANTLFKRTRRLGHSGSGRQAAWSGS